MLPRGSRGFFVGLPFKGLEVTFVDVILILRVRTEMEGM